MTMRYLLDTSALAEPIRPVPHPAFMARLARDHADCAMATVTWHEALYGVARLAPGVRRDSLHRYLHHVVAPSLPLLPYDSEAAAWHAEMRAMRERLGRPLAFADGQIAAVAYVNDLIVVTANVVDFKGLEGLQVENWLG